MFLDAIRNKNVFELKQYVDQAQVSVTFWGSRVVAMGDEQLYLDDFAEELFSFKHNNLNLVENSENWKTLAKRTINFYDEADKQVLNCNYITQFFDWIMGYSKPWCFEIPTFNTRYRIDGLDA